MPNSVIFEVPPSPRHTSHVFLLGLCVFSSLPTLFGRAKAPGSIEATLPFTYVVVWAIILTSGAIVSLVGVYWRHRLTGLLIEQFGMLFVSVATLYYTGILVSITRLDGLQNSAIIFGFGVACAIRYRQIQRYFKQVKEVRQKAAEAQELGED